MKRREFIAGLCGAAATWPLTARAQQPKKPVLGFMHSASAMEFPHQMTAFREGLKSGGFVEGQNLAVEFRWAEGKFDRLPALAADLVRHQVSVIAAMGGGYSNLAAKNATSTIPIVFNTGADPVKMGLVSSLNRPGGNITGISFFAEELGSKELGLLHELLPSVTTVGLLVNPSNLGSPRQASSTQDAGRTLGLKIEIAKADTPAAIDKAIEEFASKRVGALMVLADAFFGARVQQIVALAARYRLPAIYYRREYPLAGGLISYGTNVNDAYRQAAVYVARILKGEKAGDLPVMQSTKFEFIINLKTAKALGIKIPDKILALADEVIE